MFIVLMALWLVFNGKFTLEIFLIGLVVCAGIYLFCVKFLDYSPKKEIKVIRKTPLILKYAWVLLREIFIANFVVLKLLLSGKEIKPVLYTFRTNFKSNGSRVALSHSITLTPGTITVELVDDIYIVHCLDESLSEGMESSDFIKLLKLIEE